MIRFRIVKAMDVFAAREHRFDLSHRNGRDKFVLARKMKDYRNSNLGKPVEVRSIPREH